MLRDTESGDAAGQPYSTEGQRWLTRRSPDTESARAGQDRSADGHRGSTRPADLDEIIGHLAELQSSRLRTIRGVNRIDNAARSVPRRFLGWQWDLPEAERKRINARAQAIVNAIYDSKEPSAENREVYELVLAEVMMWREAREPLVKYRSGRNGLEPAMRKLAHRLHVWPWVGSVRGFGDLALAVLVAEAGDLSGYPDVGRLWKRFGLTPYKGTAASWWRIKKGLSDEEWEQLGYKPARNAETFAVLGDPLFRHQKAYGGPYLPVYLREKERFLAAEKTNMHAHRHGMRCMRKAAIEDLWLVWNGREPKRRPGGGQVAVTDGQHTTTPAGTNVAA